MAVLPVYVAQFTLCILLITFTVSSSTIFILLLVRFKALRTITNLLMAQLALTNLLCSSIAVSFFIYFEVMNIGTSQNCFLSASVSYIETTFCFINSYGMALIATDRYFTTEFEQRYTEWKTKTKMIRAAVACWIFPMIANTPIFIKAWKNPFQITVWKYKSSFSIQMVDISHKALLCIAFAILATMITSSVRRKVKALKILKGMNEKRKEKKEELTAVNSLAIISVIYCISFALSIAFAHITWYVNKHSTLFVWCYFISQYVIHIPSTMNIPITWFLTSRARRALKKMFSDPCGNSDLVELKRYPPVLVSQDGKSYTERNIMKPSESMMSSGRHSINFRYYKNGVCVEYDMTYPSESFLEQSFNTFSYSSINLDQSSSTSVPVSQVCLRELAHQQGKIKLPTAEYSNKVPSAIYDPQQRRHSSTEERSDSNLNGSDIGPSFPRYHSLREKGKFSNRKLREKRVRKNRTKSV